MLFEPSQRKSNAPMPCFLPHTRLSDTSISSTVSIVAFITESIVIEKDIRWTDWLSCLTQL